MYEQETKQSQFLGRGVEIIQVSSPMSVFFLFFV